MQKTKFSRQDDVSNKIINILLVNIYVIDTYIMIRNVIYIYNYIKYTSFVSPKLRKILFDFKSR